MPNCLYRGVGVTMSYLDDPEWQKAAKKLRKLKAPKTGVLTCAYGAKQEMSSSDGRWSCDFPNVDCPNCNWLAFSATMEIARARGLVK